MMMHRLILVLLVLGSTKSTFAKSIKVGTQQVVTSIKVAIAQAMPGDTVWVMPGIYKEGNIVINKRIYFLGKNLPVLDGQKKYEVLTVTADGVVVSGFKVQHSGYAS